MSDSERLVEVGNRLPNEDDLSVDKLRILLADWLDAVGRGKGAQICKMGTPAQREALVGMMRWGRNSEKK